MAEIKIPIKIDGFQRVEEMVQVVLNYTYKGRTLKEWADSISEPQTNADRIRAMTDEEMAMFVRCQNQKTVYACTNASCYDCMLDWLKQEATE